MKSKAILAIIVLAGAAWWGYVTYMSGGGAEQDNRNLRASFQALSSAIAKGNKAGIMKHLSPGFSDKKITKADLIKALTLPRTAYTAKISNLTIQGDVGSIFYVRSETRKGGEPTTGFKVSGETWMRDSADPSLWRLHRLAANDKWFRTAEIPLKKEAVKEAKAEDKPVLGTLKAEVKPKTMEEGGRYSSVGRRDPFRPLITGIAEEVASMEVCDPERPREYLESFDLRSLKLSGVISTDGAPVALIRTPDGKGYTVRASMYMGKMCGKVMGIDNDFVTIREQKRVPGSLPPRFESIETTLKLRPEEG